MTCASKGPKGPKTLVDASNLQASVCVCVCVCVLYVV